ncbi:bifunctional acetate--CoA ligase family protein/GNAT family N-acetyltransferase [Verrucomicrobium spinosum]|uniref:bifunctional acetate--CoA ligase family protein/GNAT family N-acetyltransferase n=1 Tax=Verrucomicrobium spinosum TaxID=2736 RepID=UPI00017456A0|nr:bifunctional acetate--CoA ligase family protein/GNAT family N-acetyltransferase [Verrucomicrobium spinosum]
MSSPPSTSAADQAHDILRRPQRHALAPLFTPRSIAVIGASDKPGSVGAALLQNLTTWGKPVYPVHPVHTSLQGQQAWREVAAIPHSVDLAVVATPAETVPGIIRQCANCGIPAAVILSAGFKETGSKGARLEQEVMAEARRGRMRILGPNCLGLMMPHAGLNASFSATSARPGSVAFLSQSGALCTAVLDWSLREKVGFSGFVSLGSLLDVGWGDVISYFGDEPHTRSIVCYMESAGDARRFLSAAREVALTKTIIVLKVGRTEAAARAAASHTGALTGRDAVLDAAFHRAGVLRVNTLEEMFNMAEVLAKQPPPRGPHLAIVTNAGGPGALAADRLVASGGKMAELSSECLSKLSAVLPPHWSHGNPLDILGDADVGRYAAAVEAACQEPGVDGVCVILTPQSMTAPGAIAERVIQATQSSGKPVLASWMGGAAVEQGREILNTAGIPTYDFPDMAARAFALMWRYGENLRSLYETPVRMRHTGIAADGNAAACATALIREVQQDSRSLLTETESKEILAAYGIPVVETRVATTVNHAVHLADAIGYPVAIKLHSKTVTHKSGMGGVRLDICHAEGVRLAWLEIEQAVQKAAGPGHFQGVSIQPMVRRSGCELILGSSVDPQFGPVLLFGAGGIFVEELQDQALGLPPLTATLARRLMEQTRVYHALQGGRGHPPVDLALLEQILVRFSQLIVSHPRIAEIDVNPLVASPEGMLALDARIVLHPREVPDDKLPAPAIRPYPARYIQTFPLQDGTTATIRPITPEDEPAMARFHRTLSERTVYQRYLMQMRLDQRVAHERLSRLCFIDYDCEMALVVERRPPGEDQAEILGVGRLSKLHGLNEGEFALLISDPWQGHGLGTRLLNLLVRVGRDEGLARITATMLPQNSGMQQLARRAGFTVHCNIDTAECSAELIL